MELNNCGVIRHAEQLNKLERDSASVKTENLFQKNPPLVFKTEKRT